MNIEDVQVGDVVRYTWNGEGVNQVTEGTVTAVAGHELGIGNWTGEIWPGEGETLELLERSTENRIQAALLECDAMENAAKEWDLRAAGAPTDHFIRGTRVGRAAALRQSAQLIREALGGGA